MDNGVNVNLTVTPSKKKFGVSLVFKFITMIFLLLLFVGVIRYLFGSNSPATFAEFLQGLGNVNFVNVSFADVTGLYIVGSWGPFDFIRNFLNTIISIFYIPVFLGAGIINFIALVLYCISFVFI